MNAIPLPLVLSLAGVSWVAGMATRLFTVLYPIVATDLHCLISSISHSKVFCISVMGAFGHRWHRHTSQLVSGLFPSLLSKTSDEGTKYRKNISVLALLVSDKPVSLLT